MHARGSADQIPNNNGRSFVEDEEASVLANDFVPGDRVVVVYAVHDHFLVAGFGFRGGSCGSEFRKEIS